MKHMTILAALAILLTACPSEDVMRTIENVAGPTSGLSEGEVVAGLKEALSVGSDNAASLGAKVDGFLNDPRIRIPFPEEAEKVRNTAMDIGLGAEVERFEVSLNRAAEQAAKSAAPIFLDAIKSMSIQDAFDILKGSDNAATEFMRLKTSQALFNAFKPKVEEAVAQTQVGDHWNTLATAYNTATLLTGGQQVDPDLDAYVTNRAVDGIFTLLADEEKKIRVDPQARVTDLLKKVFAAQD